VLGLLGAAAVTAVVGRNQPAAAAPALPGTTAAPGSPVRYVGVRWPAGAGSGRIRFADRAGRFGAWRRIPAGCGGGSGDAGGTDAEQTALVPAGGAGRFEVQLPPGGHAVALTSGDRPRASAAVAAGLAGCRYLDRAAWGADESLRFDATGAERYPQTYWPVQTLTVHHTATANDDPDPAARMRSIYRYQTIDRGFGDFGYHFLIDEAGSVYEGRYSGEDGVPGLDAQRRMVNASHVTGFNAGNVGVVLLGTFVDRAPTAAARDTLVRLLAALAGWVGLDPLATASYVNPISGATRTLPVIPGHRDWMATDCPGGVLYAQLPAIRQEVAGLLTAGSARSLAPAVGARS
jgi:hypothetical protein